MSPKNKIFPVAELGPMLNLFLFFFFTIIVQTCVALWYISMVMVRMMFVHIDFITRKFTSLGYKLPKRYVLCKYICIMFCITHLLWQCIYKQNIMVM